ncbi:MAG: 2-dehydropantoate 2-reductase N-terminal domain-containing protein [Solirubrobacteraceae bacterium]
MRFVIYGAGAIGGVIGARLHKGGYEVALIARGRHLEAIQANGLTLETPVERESLRLPAASDPAELEVGRAGDVVLRAVKGQDTVTALDALRAASLQSVPIVCLQNGVENERVALRRQPSVYGAVVMLPAAHFEPGIVRAYGTRLTGIVDVGCYPRGSDELSMQISAALAGSRFLSRVQEDIMRLKYAKLILNLRNVVGALCGPGEGSEALTEGARAEGRAALEAAGIDFHDPEVDDLTGRWERIGVEPINGEGPPPSSSWQSLVRGAPPGSLSPDEVLAVAA